MENENKNGEFLLNQMLGLVSCPGKSCNFSTVSWLVVLAEVNDDDGPG